MTDNSVEMRRLKEYFDIELLREKQYSEYITDRLKKEIRDLKVERDEARELAEMWREYYAAETPAERQSVEDGKWIMPWEADHA